MSTVDPAPAGTVSPRRHWLLFLGGVLLFFIGPALYAVEFRLRHLGVPWYVPLLASAGVVLMAASLWHRRGVVRALVMVIFTLVCGLEWFLLAVGTKSPAYTGPAQPGRTVPEFVARLSDGTPFTEQDLAQGGPTVLLFFRGRW
jgi:hypothetical protein